MARLTEEMVIARSKQSDLNSIRKLNCWGAELADVSILRRMPNIEVLAFSLNKLRSLSCFASCSKLRELYLRKNEISDLRDLRYLRRLPRLTALWLEENPCAEHPYYRQTVLRNLPNLEKLDNIVVHPDEVETASQRGTYIPDSDEEEEIQQQEVQYCRRTSVPSSPEPETPTHRTHEQPTDPLPELPTEPKMESQPVEESGSESPPPAMTRSYHPERCPAETSPGVRHSQSALNVKEYAYTSNGSGENYYERCDRNDSGRSEVSSSREYPSAVMGNLRGFTRRPVTRNSNLLSAVLCLVKELDYPSLEVAEMAVRCRMDELANSQ